jgi:hypothetical protein
MFRDAATNEDPGALRTQLRRGENVDAVDHQGRTALHVDQKSIDCVEREAAGAMNDFPCLAIRGHLCLCRFTQDYGMVRICGRHSSDLRTRISLGRSHRSSS